MIDVAGDYVAQLIVNDGTVDSAPDTVRITTGNSAPVADPGPNQTRTVGSRVTLSGSASVDVDNDQLSYRWSFTSRPAGSAAVIESATAVTAFFNVDAAGTYVVQLIVNDGEVDSAPATVRVSTENTAPVAVAGFDASALIGEVITLDGTASVDVDGDPIAYAWSIQSRPAASQAAFANPALARPSFTVDV
ncbi:MAG: hypothetical protein HC888_08685, partial [Candidatus Competibacteraceae bacterium]|nr:hypothetical protein [Candidatus Competibacteraceae bacterium]